MHDARRRRFGGPADVAHHDWCYIVLVCATFQLVIDLVLLDRAFNFLNGGFLAWNAVEGPIESGTAILALWLANVAVLAPCILLLVHLGAVLNLRRAATIVLAVGAGPGPLIALTAASYQVTRYLRDLQDVAVLYELSGASAAEILAVAIDHLHRPVVAIGLYALIFALVVLAVNRGWHTSQTRVAPHALSRVAATSLAAMTIHVAIRVTSDAIDFGSSKTVTGRVIARLAEQVTDVDHDGFGLLARPRDPDAQDARIRPYAIDWPANGIDEDGIGGDLPASVPAFAESTSEAVRWAVQPSVAMVLLESVRADAVAATLDGKPVTPVLDELSSRGVFTREAWAHNGFTSPARRHLFTGSLAGLRDSTTIVDDFKAQGYEVAYFSGQDEDFGGAAFDVGMRRADRWFHAPDAPHERYTRFTTPGSLALPFDAVERRVAEFLRERSPERPLLLIVNFHDTHFPYTHAGIKPILDSTIVRQADIVPGTAAPLRRMYLNTLANVDAAIGRVLDALTSTTGAAPAVVVTSDHGESLFDDGTLGHGFSLASVQNRVPLIVTGLGVEIPVPFGHADFRDRLHAALLAGETTPRLVPRTAGPVVQYVGSLHEPAAMAAVTAESSIVYDFREDRIRRDGGPWQTPADLGPENRDEFLALIHLWESIRLAQSKAAAP